MKTDLIYEAYLQVVNEANEPKFNVGDQVGIGHFNGGYGGYNAHDTGTVTKVNKFGHHTVEYHSRKDYDDNTKPLVKIFDANGKSREQYSNAGLISKDEHVKHVKSISEQNIRTQDLNTVLNHLKDHQMPSGHFTKLHPLAASAMKDLIDKHMSKLEE